MHNAEFHAKMRGNTQWASGMKKLKVSDSRSLTFPIVMASVTVPLGLFVLAGWIWVILRNQELTQQVYANRWLMVAGISSLITIITALVLLTVFLSREILEGRHQTRFIDSVTHELKSPLAALRLCAQTLERKNLPEKKRAELHQMMVDDIDRLSYFIDDILQSSRTAHGPKDQRHKMLDLKTILTSCIKRVCSRYHIPQSVITIEDNSTGLIYTDQSTLEMILRNLLDNAIKYSLPNPEILCLIEPVSKNKIHISIKDNGIGIPLQHQHRVFSRFFRAPGEAVRNRSGTGLGLYVAAQLVRGLGSELRLYSAGANEGSRFHFSLGQPYPPEQNEYIQDTTG
jgi:signal transduction histidine kinase